MNFRIAPFVLCLAFCFNGFAAAGDWQPVSSPLETPWTHMVDPKSLAGTSASGFPACDMAVAERTLGLSGGTGGVQAVARVH
jgi:hypothetical protein